MSNQASGSIPTSRLLIDQIDDQIVQLICKRLVLAREIREKKIELGLPFKDDRRENEILSRIKTLAPSEDQDLIVDIYRRLFAVVTQAGK